MEPIVSEERSDMAHDGEEDFGLDQFEAAFTDLRAVLVRPAAPEVAAGHVARMQATATSTVAASAVSTSVSRGPQAAESFWTMPRKMAAAIAAVAVGLFGLGGLGMAGALPGPVQDFVATVTDPLGLDMPRSDDPAPADKGNGKETGTTEPGRGSGATLAPGQTGSTPGQSGETPANGAEPPGQSGSTPGQTGDNPSVTAPGQTGDTPSVTAPGQVESPSATAPRQSGSAPGQSGSAGANGNAGGSGNAGGNGNAGGSGNGGTAPGRT
jgi:hypothetical protein